MQYQLTNMLLKEIKNLNGTSSTTGILLSWKP